MKLHWHRWGTYRSRSFLVDLITHILLHLHILMTRLVNIVLQMVFNIFAMALVRDMLFLVNRKERTNKLVQLFLSLFPSLQLYISVVVIP